MYLLNRSFTSSVDGKTPYEAWHGRKPSVEHLRVFGCVVHVKNARPHLRKLDDRSIPMVFIGYEAGSKAYRVYDPVTRRVHVTRDAVFDEAASWDWGKDGAAAARDLEEFAVYTVAASPPTTAQGAAPAEHSRSTSPVSPESAPPAPSPSPATATPPTSPRVEFATPPSRPGTEFLDDEDDGELHRYHRVSDLIGDDASPPGLAERLLLTTAEEPNCVAEAQQDASWSKAMKDELGSIEENGTWALVELPPGHKPIGLKWVFKVKRDETGAVIKHKARLVANTSSEKGLTSRRSSPPSPGSIRCGCCSPSPPRRGGRCTTST